MNIDDCRYKAMVLSDTHGDTDAILRLLPIMETCDAVIHLGDHAWDMDVVEAKLGAKLYRVAGNNDYRSRAPSEAVIELGPCKIFATHGHLYGVNVTRSRLRARAATLGCSIALFGHTHVSAIFDDGDIAIMNPGSLRLPRDGIPSYGMVYGDEHFSLKIIFNR